MQAVSRQLRRQRGRHPEAVGGILHVGDRIVDGMPVHQPIQVLADQVAAGAAVHVADEEDVHPVTSRSPPRGPPGSR